MNVAHGSVSPAPSTISILMIAAAGLVLCFAPATAADTNAVRIELVPTSAIAQPHGATVFADHCAACHGLGGTGRTRAEVAIGRSIPDLTGIEARDGIFDRRHVLAHIAGQADRTASPEEMPCWSSALKTMSEDTTTNLLVLRNLVRHLETMQRPLEMVEAEPRSDLAQGR